MDVPRFLGNIAYLSSIHAKHEGYMKRNRRSDLGTGSTRFATPRGCCSKSADMLEIEDVQPGMWLKGTVRNVVDIDVK